MRIERGFLRSRVARRIVAAFVLCALVPILATAVLSYDHVRKLLFDQSYLHLAQLVRRRRRPDRQGRLIPARAPGRGRRGPAPATTGGSPHTSGGYPVIASSGNTATSQPAASASS